MLYYNERPIISRNLIGTEPARNLQYGLDLNYRKDSRLLTKLVDACPLFKQKKHLPFPWMPSLPSCCRAHQILWGVRAHHLSMISRIQPRPYSLQNVYKVGSWHPYQRNFNTMVDCSTIIYRLAIDGQRLAWYTIDNLGTGKVEIV